MYIPDIRLKFGSGIRIKFCKLDELKVSSSAYQARYAFKKKDVKSSNSDSLESFPSIVHKNKSSKKPRYRFTSQEIEDLDLNIA